MFEFAASLQECCSGTPMADDRVILLYQRQTVLSCAAGQGMFPFWREVHDIFPVVQRWFFIGEYDGCRYFAAEVPELPELPISLKELQIRQFLFEYSEDYQMALCRAKGIIAWMQQHRYCGRCRAGLKPSANDSGLQCPDCNAVYYPQLAPAVIVGITRNNGKELLLAHNRNFAGNMYSLIAGFVEAGESVEAAVHREVWEECSIRIKNLKYITSQMWPFPNSLMLAFTAEYDSGTAEADGGELSDLGWFTVDEHPELPSPGSVARLVIDRIFNQ